MIGEVDLGEALRESLEPSCRRACGMTIAVSARAILSTDEQHPHQILLLRFGDEQEVIVAKGS